MANISQESLSLLNNQIKNERYNESIYLYIGSYLKKMGLDNIGNHFYDTQVNEEREHMKDIANYINDRNETVLALSVPDGNVTINSLTHLAEIYLEREQITTEQLKVITQRAFQEADYLLFDFAREMVAKQRHEEDEALRFLDRARMADNDLKVWLIWDSTFSK